MLIEFRVENYRSFAESRTLSLLASKDKEHPDNLIEWGKHRVLKTVALYGANASGKSNLIKALGTMSRFVEASATTMNQGDEIPIEPFAFDPEYRDRPTTFEVTMVIENIRYQYGFSATRERVLDEWLLAWPKGFRQGWLERTTDCEANKTAWKWRGPLEHVGAQLEARTRENGLALSRGAELNVPELSLVYLWFKKALRIHDASNPLIALMPVAGTLWDNSEFRGFAELLVRGADTGIDGLDVATREYTTDSIPKEVKEILQEEFLQNIVGQEFHQISTRHRGAEQQTTVSLRMEEESNGTQRLFALAGPIWDSLQHGHIVAIDELDCSMHPLLARKLIELFHSPKYNKKGAQLIFTTHDATLMDLSLMRRDQICIMEKNGAGASDLYTLYDFKEQPRKTEAVARRYLAGRYGGIPVFGAMLEDL